MKDEIHFENITYKFISSMKYSAFRKKIGMKSQFFLVVHSKTIFIFVIPIYNTNLVIIVFFKTIPLRIVIV